MSGLFVTGTDTGVGKTVLTAGLVLALRETGLDVGVCKPIQSGALAADPEGDAALLRGWTGVAASVEEIAPFSFAEPVAPLVAARGAGVELDQEAVFQHVRRLASRYDLLVVEGAGGLVVPAGERWTMAELAGRLRYPVVVVARPGLGTVNHTLLTVMGCRRLGVDVLGVILNGDDPGAEANAGMIAQFGDVAVLGRTPRLEGELTAARLLALTREHVDVEGLGRALRTKETVHD